jgi:ribonuclease R
MTKKNKPINKKSGTNPKKKATRVSTRRGLTNEQIEQTVRKLFESEPNKVFNYKQVCYLFGQTSMSQKRQVVSVLEALVVFGFLTEVEMGRYRLKHAERKTKGNALEGTFRYFRGNASVVVEGMEEPLAIEERDAAHALDGDKVRIAQTTLKGRVERKVWQVTKILERSTRTYVGKIKITRQGAFVTNESRDMRMPIQILEEDLGEVEDRDKVIVRVRSWSSRDRNPIGEIVDILGKTGSADAEMHAILAEYGLPYHYPEEVEQAATSLSGEITEEALREREDFRLITTFTIDPRDAKDFDDALSIRKLENGNWEIGVHIADVSHFVRPGDIIDKEAYNRATSIYLVDRTIPMLPEYLSNGLCSLRPNEDKYSYSCIFEMSDDAKVQASRIVRTVICSDRRFTYEEAQEIIERGEGDYAEEILTLNRLAQQIREERFKAGSIAFERPEVRFLIDDAGKPISVYLKESLPAHQLIEEFMLLANKTVAERIGRRRGNAKVKPFVYRVHDEPDMEKLGQLSSFAATLGYTFKVGASSKAVSKNLNKFLAEVKDKPEGDKFATIAVRTMAKAKYTTDNIGHYGLAFPYYTHFTSPIRRYPDLMVHRLLTHYLVDKGAPVDEALLERECEHSSAMEVLASQAERSSIRYKQVEYMQQYLGYGFEGTISGLAEWGIYVELNDSKCEGLIPMRDLSDDYYEYDEKNFCLVGRSSGRRYVMGDQLVVRVAGANLERKQLDFQLIESKE